MADKIVQLKDKNSNNLYPISGSSLAESVSTGAIVDGAVTTAKVADGAVTSDKIDLTTISFVMPLVDNISFSGWDNHFFQSQTVTLVPNAKYLLLSNTNWLRCWNGNSRELAIYVNGERMQLGYIPNGWSYATFSFVFEATQASNLIQTGGRGDWNQQDNSNKCRIGATTCHLIRLA